MDTNDAQQLTLGVDNPPHNNRNLFSDHYLNILLQSDPRWPAAADQAQSFHTWLRDLHAAEGHRLPTYNESQLEDHWFRPIFRRLGHTYEGQPTVPGLGKQIKRPDYIFFPHDDARQHAAAAQGTAAYAAEALAVGEVKAWDVPLGKKVKGGGPSFSDQNPSYQIDYYLKTTGLHWGILSNGRRWRLVHRDTSQRLTVYYEIDLIDLLQRDDAGAMRAFTLFFRQAAFRPDANGRIFLDDALRASSEYALALEEDLQDNVYRALEQLMQGFLDLPQNNLGAADLPAVYDNSLILLYRLLFIFYAESRELLPVRNHQYREHYSLGDLGREIAGDNVPTAPFTTGNWSRVQTLFHIVNGDNQDLNRHLGVPRYNGGLFSPDLHPFLEEKAVGDRALARAVDLLARRETGANGQTGRETVDYRTLGVRQLGSIYEGLLEYRPQLAGEDVVAVRESSREEVWLPAAEAPEGATIVDRRRAGNVYLATDRGERKATGSYYTPQHIVAYIVDNTLGPLVEESAERAHAAHEAAANDDQKAAAAQSLVDAVLDLNILDPAMGSGHFLVEATDYLARELATDPIVQRPAADTAVQSDAASLEDGPEGLEDDVIYWRRRVVERCIYGVDKNPLAVELAKLSLWLSTVAADQPLSFLDHHLQCGDSLVGADVADLGWAPPAVLSKKAQKKMEQQKAGQMNLFEYRLGQQLPAVLGKVLEITGRESDSYETVQAKEAADEAVRQLKAPFAAVADLWTSAYFGNDYGPAEYGEALDALTTDRLWQMPAVQRAREIAADRRFFHWHLAFPEVFYDQNGQWRREAAGFDAVVGNPPYVRPHHLSTIFKKFLWKNFSSFVAKSDLYVCFIQLGLEKLRNKGRIGLITSDSWLYLDSFEEIRTQVLEHTQVSSLFDLPDGVFRDATVKTIVFILEKDSGATRRKIRILRAETRQAARNESEALQFELPQHIFEETYKHVFDLSLTPSTVTLKKKVASASRELGALTSSYFGLKTGDDSIFLRTERLSREDKPLLRGANIGRYEYSYEGEYVWYVPDKMREHRRTARPGEPTRFELPKILVRDTLGELAATYDDSGFYVKDVLILQSDDEEFELLYLLAVLNSRLMRWYYETSFPTLHVQRDELASLPIRKIEFATPADERQRLLEKGQKLYDRYCQKDDLACVTGFVEHELEQGRSDVVHDLLAYLAQQMIAMNQEKQQRVEAFWLDLEGVADPDDFDTLRHRGKWEASLWKAEPCRPFVDQNSRSTRHLDDTLGWNEASYKAFVKMLAPSLPNLSDLVHIYRRHHPPYATLTTRLTATDHLIDHIVYHLYNLTEEEIAIVEGG